MTAWNGKLFRGSGCLDELQILKRAILINILQVALSSKHADDYTLPVKRYDCISKKGSSRLYLSLYKKTFSMKRDRLWYYTLFKYYSKIGVSSLLRSEVKKNESSFSKVA